MSEKLTVRDWTPADMPKLSEFHQEMAVGYQLPAQFGPIWAIQKTVTDENGEIVAMAAVRLTSEAYFWQNQGISEISRAKSLILLSEAMTKEAKALGLEDVACFIPQKIAECFGKVIEKLGWKPVTWKCWGMVFK